MKFRLENTSYLEFNAWLRLRADKYEFLVSYDESGLREDKSDLNFIPQEIYPLQIFLSKIYQHRIAYDNDGVFIVEKAGSDLVICPKPLSEIGRENLKPILTEIANYWPKTKTIIKKALTQSSIGKEQSKEPPGRDPYPGYDAAFNFWKEQGFAIESKQAVFNYWFGNPEFEDEWTQSDKLEARKKFDNAMRRRKTKHETRNST
jgi:hypothetical protein